MSEFSIGDTLIRVKGVFGDHRIGSIGVIEELPTSIDVRFKGSRHTYDLGSYEMADSSMGPKRQRYEEIVF